MVSTKPRNGTSEEGVTDGTAEVIVNEGESKGMLPPDFA